MPNELSDFFSVAGQVVLVSGGSRGIGRELAAGFVQRGAQVVITGRKKETIEQTAREISLPDNAVKSVVCDVSNPAAHKELVSQVVAECGHIDTLLNVAGVNIRKKAESYTVEEYDYIINTNLRGLFFLSTEVGRHMIERKSGNIINIDSLNSKSPLRGVLPYAISKGGVSMITRGMALEWGEHGIRVNAIAPGFILTDLTRKLWSQPTMNAWGMANIPLKRLGETPDLVGTAIFLASPASAYMTGQILYVDGGIYAGHSWPIDL